MSILDEPELLELFLGELFSRPASEFTARDLSNVWVRRKFGPTHHHSGCHCEACEVWFGDLTGNAGQKRGFDRHIRDRLPLSMDSVLCPGIAQVDFRVTSRPWQQCDCRFCARLVWSFDEGSDKADLENGASIPGVGKADFETPHKPGFEKIWRTSGELKLRDVHGLRWLVDQILVPSILPLPNGGNPPSKVYLLRGGNTMDVRARVQGSVLKLDIHTTSTDGATIDHDEEHEKGIRWGSAPCS